MTKFIFFMLFSCSVFAKTNLNTLSFDSIKLVDLAKVVYSDLLKTSYVFEGDFLRNDAVVSLQWNDLSQAKIKQLTDDIFKTSGFDLSLVGGVLHIRNIKKTDNEFFIYKVQYRSSKYLSEMTSKFLGIASIGSRASGGQEKISSNTPDFAVKESAGTVAGNSDKNAFDQLVYSCFPADCIQLKFLLALVDVPEPQVILRAIIYEVGTNKTDGSAIQMIGNVVNNGLGLSATLGAVGSGNATFKINSAGFDAVVSLLDQDGRFKSVSRPMLRVKSGASAKFSVGSSTPVLGAITAVQNGQPVQSVEYKPSGTIFSVQADVRGSVIDLSVNQELSAFVATSTGVNNSPTLLQRSASSQLSIKDGEVVVFAGLEESKDDLARSGFFGLNLSSKKSSNSSEVVVLIEATKL